MTLVTFLELSPEFGGQRFGPFPGVEIRLGSEPEVNDIVLPETLGVSPQHVKVLQQGEESFIIAPVDRTSTVYIWRSNSNRPKQINTPMAVRPGDAFSLVTPEGPRFTILQEQAPRNVDKKGGTFADRAKRRMPTASGMFEEIKRRGMAKVFATRLGNTFQYAYRFVISGQIFNPVYVVAMLMAVSGWFFAGGASCAALSQNWDRQETKGKLTVCQDQLRGETETGQQTNTIPYLTRKVLADPEWNDSIREDRVLAKEYYTALDAAFTMRETWFIKDKKRGPARMRRALSGLPDPMKDVFAFAAMANRKERLQWRVIYDSAGRDVCGRGPLGLTYRQAIRLGLENVQLDALVSRSNAMSASIEDKRNSLVETASFTGEPVILDGTTITSAPLIQGGRECLFVEGPDDRDDYAKIAGRIRTVLGPNARGLPSEGQPFWMAYRLFKLGAMDFEYGYDELKFNRTSKAPSIQLSSQNVPPPQIEFASRYASQIMATAVASRCMLVLDKNYKDAPPEGFGDNVPVFDDCLLLRGRVEYEL